MEILGYDCLWSDLTARLIIDRGRLFAMALAVPAIVWLKQSALYSFPDRGICRRGRARFVACKG
jgi:hypothetical protein